VLKVRSKAVRKLTASGAQAMLRGKEGLLSSAFPKEAWHAVARRRKDFESGKFNDRRNSWA
jgi:hypothetical protein